MINLRDIYPNAPEDAVHACYLLQEDESEDESPVHPRHMSDGAIALYERLSRPGGKAYIPWICNVAGTRDEWAIKVLLATRPEDDTEARHILTTALSMGPVHED